MVFEFAKIGYILLEPKLYSNVHRICVLMLADDVIGNHTGFKLASIF
jgi:hypothetical protein